MPLATMLIQASRRAMSEGSALAHRSITVPAGWLRSIVAATRSSSEFSVSPASWAASRLTVNRTRLPSMREADHAAALRELRGSLTVSTGRCCERLENLRQPDVFGGADEQRVAGTRSSSGWQCAGC